MSLRDDHVPVPLLRFIYPKEYATIAMPNAMKISPVRAIGCTRLRWFRLLFVAINSSPVIVLDPSFHLSGNGETMKILCFYFFVCFVSPWLRIAGE